MNLYNSVRRKIDHFKNDWKPSHPSRISKSKKNGGSSNNNSNNSNSNSNRVSAQASLSRNASNASANSSLAEAREGSYPVGAEIEKDSYLDGFDS